MTNHNPTDRTIAVTTPRRECGFIKKAGHGSKCLPQETYWEGSDLAAVRSIVVPLDGSQYAEHALPYALAIARRSGAVLRVVHVKSHLDHVEPWQMHCSIETNERRKR